MPRPTAPQSSSSESSPYAAAPRQGAFSSSHSTLTQRASLRFGASVVELTTDRGAVLVAASRGRGRAEHLVLPVELTVWETEARKLLGAAPTEAPGDSAEFRTPFATSADNLPAFAMMCRTSESGVEFGLRFRASDGSELGIDGLTRERAGELLDAIHGAARVAALSAREGESPSRPSARR